MWFTYFGNWARQSNLTNHIVSFILESTTSKMATIEEAFDIVCKTFRISALNAPQKNGITKIVEERRDVFINLPTGFGEERSDDTKNGSEGDLRLNRQLSKFPI